MDTSQWFVKTLLVCASLVVIAQCQDKTTVPVISRDPCLANPCLNGGRCSSPLDLPVCDCLPGFAGDRCETSLEPEPDCGKPCEEGKTCVLRQPECDGDVCIQALQPICLPDACADCRVDQDCREIPNTCVPGDAGCPEFRYICGLRGDDECNKDRPCKEGYYCGTGVICADGPPVTTGRIPRSTAAPAASRSSILADPFCAEVNVCLLVPTTIVPPKEKEGLCPALPPYGGVGICGGTFCGQDSDCAGADKCCRALCGGNLCTKPEADLGCGLCPWGEFCVQKPSYCPEGVICDIRPPECVPEACAACTDEQECRKIQSNVDCPLGTYCPENTYFCGLKSSKLCDERRTCSRGEVCQENIICSSQAQPQTQSTTSERSLEGVLLDPFCADVSRCELDQCGGCPEGEDCKFTDTTFECVKNDPCGGCGPGQECRDMKLFLFFGQSNFKCADAPPSCPAQDNNNKRPCFLKPQCNEDFECGSEERCCDYECNRKTCYRTVQTPKPNLFFQWISRFFSWFG